MNVISTSEPSGLPLRTWHVVLAVLLVGFVAAVIGVTSLLPAQL